MLVRGPYGPIFACREGFTRTTTHLIEISPENSSAKNFRCTHEIKNVWFSDLKENFIFIKSLDFVENSWIFNVPTYVCKYSAFE